MKKITQTFRRALKLQALKFHAGHQMFCPKCKEILDCRNAVSIDFVGATSGDLHKTFCFCCKCERELNYTTAVEYLEDYVGEKIKIEKTDGSSATDEEFEQAEMIANL